MLIICLGIFRLNTNSEELIQIYQLYFASHRAAITSKKEKKERKKKTSNTVNTEQIISK